MKKEHQNALIFALQEASHDQATLESFLHAILTPQEFQDIVLRLQIVRLLKQGMPQRDIAKTLGTGIATVTRGARELRTPKNGFDMVFAACEKNGSWNWRHKDTVCR